MKRLLIQACSGRKAATIEPLPAIELYDGVAFRVIKKFLRENPNAGDDLEILILSAEYGLISSESRILTYDRRMDCERAKSLKTQIKTVYNKKLSESRFERVFVNVGSAYLPALREISIPVGATFASGGIGFRNSQLKSWLNK